MEPDDRSDEALMRAVVAGDLAAFEALYDRYSRLVFSTAYRVLEEPASAEDVAQEVFVRIWQRPQRYVEQRGKFLGWMLSVTRNRAIDHVRSRGRRRRNESQIIDQPEGEFIASESSQAPFHTAEMVDQRALVREALAALPREQRDAIQLAYYNGLTQSEIAEALQTPLGTVKTRIRLGMQKLRVALDGCVGVLDRAAPPSEPESA